MVLSISEVSMQFKKYWKKDNDKTQRQQTFCIVERTGVCFFRFKISTHSFQYLKNLRVPPLERQKKELFLNPSTNSMGVLGKVLSSSIDGERTYEEA